MGIRDAVEQTKTEARRASDDARDAALEKNAADLVIAFDAMLKDYLNGGSYEELVFIDPSPPYDYSVHPEVRWDGYRFQRRYISEASSEHCLGVVLTCGKCGRDVFGPLYDTARKWAKPLPEQLAEAEKNAKQGVLFHGSLRRYQGCYPPEHEPRYQCVKCGKGPEAHAEHEMRMLLTGR